MNRLTIYFVIFLLFCINAFSQYWEKVTNIPNPYISNYWLDVHFLNSNQNYGWICGFNGMVIRTTDGGATWYGTQILQANQLESICFPTPLVGYTSGPSGIYKSTDGGATFFDVSPPSSDYIWGNYFLDENNGVVVGGGCIDSVQHFWRTTDGGANWSEFRGNEPNSGLTHVILYSNNGLGYASSSGRIWRTTDGGYTWSIFSTTGSNLWAESIDNINSTFIVPQSGNTCQGGGTSGGIRMSINNGASWNLYNTGQPIFGTKLINEQTAWACGYKASLYYTSNGGINWELKNCGIQNNDDLDDLWFLSPNSGYAVGRGVYKMSPPTIKYSKNEMIFGMVCIPKTKYDTVKIYNYSYNSSSFSTQILGSTDFRVVSPLANFNLGPCDSINVIVAFTPTGEPIKNGTLRIISNGVDYKDISLNGSGLIQSAKVNTNLIVINKLQVNSRLDTLIYWTSNNDFEEIAYITQIYGSDRIVLASTFPQLISKNGLSTRFSINPNDTGWIEAKFKALLTPCNEEIEITIKVYGVTPIISSERSRTIFSLCDKISYDSLAIQNTGNDTLLLNTASFNNPNFEVIGFINGKNLPHKIAPKKTDTLIVKFTAPSYGKYNALLKITNNDSTKVLGNKNPYFVDYKAEFYSSKLAQRDSIIDFGVLCLNNNVILSTKVINNGNLKAYLRLKKQLDLFEVYSQPNNFPIPISPNDSAYIFIKIKAQKLGIIIDTLYVYSDECTQELRFILKANIINLNAAILPANYRSILQTNTPKIEKFKILSMSEFDITIKKAEIKPNSAELSYKFNFPYGKIIKAFDSLNIELELTANKDTASDYALCIEFEGKCNGEICSPIKVVSLSNWTEINKNYIDFGLQKCQQTTLSNDVTIYNKGMTTDTIIEIKFDNANFDYQPKINLPYILKSGDSLIFQIYFSKDKSGVELGNLKIVTQNFKDKAFEVILKGESKFSDIVLNANEFNFGMVEKCSDDRFFSLKIYNNDELTDTLEIIRNNPLKEISIEKEYLREIKGGDSIEVLVKLNPSLIDNLGAYSEDFIFKQKSCGKEFKFQIKYELIEAKLIASDSLLDFGSLWKNDKLQKSFKLINNSKVDIIVNQIILEPMNVNYTFNHNAPITILANNFKEILVTFSAIDEGYNNSICKIYYKSQCLDSLQINFKAETKKELYRVNLATGDYSIDAGKDFTVHTLLLDSVYRFEPNEVKLTYAYDGYLFHPISVKAKSNGKMNEIQFVDNKNELSFALNKDISEKLFNKKDTILFIYGIAMPSLPDFTAIKIKEIEFSNAISPEFTQKEGSLKVTGFCKNIAVNKIKLLGSINLYNVKIEGTSLNFNINSNINTFGKLLLYNLIGDLLLEEELTIRNVENSYSINIKNLSSGIYFIEFKGDLFNTKEILIK